MSDKKLPMEQDYPIVRHADARLLLKWVRVGLIDHRYGTADRLAWATKLFDANVGLWR